MILFLLKPPLLFFLRCFTSCLPSHQSTQCAPLIGQLAYTFDWTSASDIPVLLDAALTRSSSEAPPCSASTYGTLSASCMLSLHSRHLLQCQSSDVVTNHLRQLSSARLINKPTHKHSFAVLALSHPSPNLCHISRKNLKPRCSVLNQHQTNWLDHTTLSNTLSAARLVFVT